jgi:hypothetical protein
MSLASITSVVKEGGGNINYIYDSTNSKYMWARSATINIKLPWGKFSSWSISRISSYEPAASKTVVAQSGSYSYFVDGSELSISGYYGDVYQLTRTVKAGYAGVIADKAKFETDPTFSFEDMSGYATTLQPPTISNSLSGRTAQASVYNPNSCKVIIRVYLSDSQYYTSGILGKDYERGNVDGAKEYEVAAYGTCNFSLQVSSKGTVNYFNTCARCKPASGTAYTESSLASTSWGTKVSTSTGGGGSGVGGGGGQLESDF